ncbi:MAG: Uma2 family endonuclease [Chloroflexi bacterium]|nr:Uma2 family endonuclease [Chloroflexota bacterium]
MIAQPVLADTHITYPESDGQPMADNTQQFRWIVTLHGGLTALLRDTPNVFVAGDLLWYPVEGRPDLRCAPDVMVVFGRPPKDRGSYLQWQEDDIAPQVVFEIISPGNTFAEMKRKFKFYEQYGVAEYYLYDPDTGELEGWQRAGDALTRIESMRGWISPRLKIRFELLDNELHIYHPDGQPFVTYEELAAQLSDAEDRAAEAEDRAADAEDRAAREHQRAERLSAQLRALGIEPTKFE